MPTRRIPLKGDGVPNHQQRHRRAHSGRRLGFRLSDEFLHASTQSAPALATDALPSPPPLGPFRDVMLLLGHASHRKDGVWRKRALAALHLRFQTCYRVVRIINAAERILQPLQAPQEAF